MSAGVTPRLGDRVRAKVKGVTHRLGVINWVSGYQLFQRSDTQVRRIGKGLGPMLKGATRVRDYVQG